MLLNACGRKKDPCPERWPDRYEYLSDSGRSKVPYFQTKFDTISFTSDIGDTLVFTSEKNDSFWALVAIGRDFDCEYGNDYAEVLHKKYTAIKGTGTLGIFNAARKSIVFSPPSNRTSIIPDIIEIYFNDFQFLIMHQVVENPEISSYADSVTFNNSTFYHSMWVLLGSDTTSIAKGYYNKTYGLFRIEDHKKNINWTIVQK